MLQSGSECWFDTQIHPQSLPGQDGCNMKCSGSDEICGGSNRLSMFSTTASPGSSSTFNSRVSSASAVPSSTSSAVQSGTTASPIRPASYGTYAYQNCYVEPSGGRVLSRQLAASDSMTVGICGELAKAANMNFFGLEYGRECWSANSLLSGVSTAPDSECNKVCSGDATT